MPKGQNQEALSQDLKSTGSVFKSCKGKKLKIITNKQLLKWEKIEQKGQITFKRQTFHGFERYFNHQKYIHVYN